MAWYDYLSAAGDTLSDAGTALHGFQRERRDDARDDVLDKRALLREHQLTQEFTNQQRDRKQTLGKEYYDAADPDQIFMKDDENFQLMFDAIGAKGFTSVPGVPGGMKILETPTRELERRTTEYDLSKVKGGQKAWDILNAPGFFDRPRAVRENVGRHLGLELEVVLKPEERLAENQMNPQVLATGIRQNMYQVIQMAQIQASTQRQLRSDANELIGHWQSIMEAKFPNQSFATETPDNYDEESLKTLNQLLDMQPELRDILQSTPLAHALPPEIAARGF